MKKFLNHLIRYSAIRTLELIESTIDHKAFKPVAISLLTCFILLNSIDYAEHYIADRKEKQLLRLAKTPIKITITKDGKAINFNEIQVIEKRVKNGDTLSKIISSTGASDDDVFAILTAMKKVFNPQSIAIDDSVLIKYKLQISYDDTGKELQGGSKNAIINEVRVIPAPDLEIIVSRDAKGAYVAKEIKQQLTRTIVKYSGSIKNGLYVDGVSAGISPTSMMNMINLYAYEIDFQRDLHDGNKFEMLVESFYTDKGRKVKDGKVLFSLLALKNRTIEIYGHSVNGNFEYFDSKGNSVKKSLLRTPVNGARISSGFGFRRHPILGYSKLHKGIDFAAPSGTPILAAGNGVIQFMGRFGGYGNFVRIKHNNEYETQYGHASAFSKKFRVGSKVRQGEVVAYVGSTGRSTGPHLHFEILYRGKAINPASVKSVSGIRLAGAELVRFNTTKADIDNYRKRTPNEIKRVN